MPRPRTLITLFLAGAMLLACWAFADPRVALLVDRDESQWIRAPEAFSPIMRRPSRERSFFRASVQSAAEEGRSARASIRAFRSAVVSLDGVVVYDSARREGSWKQAGEFELRLTRKGSQHQLLVVAENDDAHPAILLACSSLGIHTDSSWEASKDGIRWVQAVPVDTPTQLPIWDEADTVSAAFAKTLPWQGSILLVLAGCCLLARFRPGLRRLATASHLRWILLLVWVVLAANNYEKLPLRHGFDASDHVDYVRFLLAHKRLPLANDGWQMFQPPLFYCVSAIVSPILSWVDASLERSLRLLPLLCGLLQIEITYRIMRSSFPGQNGLQSVGLLIGSFLPVNIYMSQAVGNEPMFAVFSSAVLLWCVTMFRSPPTSWKDFLGLGVLLGLALLTKATGWLLFPIVTVVILSGKRFQGRLRFKITGLLVTFGSTFTIAGWFYLRNWFHFRKLVIGGWDEEIGILWWQDPGYRTLDQLFGFGFSLKTPVFAAVRGFWDALYSSLWADGTLSGVIAYPPWNYSFMFPALWFGLFLTGAIVFGAIARVPAESASARSLALCAALTFLLALMVLYLEIPIYTTAKASYTLGISPCYGILAAVGLRPLLARGVGRAFVAGLLAVFTAFVVVAYFVV